MLLSMEKGLLGELYKAQKIREWFETTPNQLIRFLAKLHEIADDFPNLHVQFTCKTCHTIVPAISVTEIQSKNSHIFYHHRNHVFTLEVYDPNKW
jgi:hypothetical protein